MESIDGNHRKIIAANCDEITNGLDIPAQQVHLNLTEDNWSVAISLPGTLSSHPASMDWPYEWVGD